MIFLDEKLIKLLLKGTKLGDLKWAESAVFNLDEEIYALGADEQLKSFACTVSTKKGKFSVCIARKKNNEKKIILAVFKDFEELIHIRYLYNDKIKELFNEVVFCDHDIYDLLRYLDKYIA